MSGEWPPDWEDPDEVFPDQAEQPGEDTGARLSEVSAFLATVPAPVLPDSVAARISAAIAAEAAARAGDSGQPVENSAPVDNEQAVDNQPPGDRREAGDSAQPVDNRTTGPGEGTAGGRTLGRAPGRARVRRRRLSPRKLLMAGPVLAVCLLFGGIVYAMSNAPSSSSSSAGSSAAAPAATAPADSASGTSGTGDRTAAGAAEPPAFTVTDSGTRYEQATLAGQARGALAGSAPSAGTSQPGPELVGCVQHFTGGSQPRLVDRATYQGTPAYVIASSSRVWVVGLGCSAANPELITSVPLAG